MSLDEKKLSKLSETLLMAKSGETNQLAKTPSEATKLSTWFPYFNYEICEISTDHRCGISFGKKICAHGWCSKWNWCGSSSDHSSTHQADYDSSIKGNPRCKNCVTKKRIR